MNAEELRITTMDQEHRVLGQVTLDDAAQADGTVLGPHGRGRRGPPRVHPAQCQGRPLPRHLSRSQLTAAERIFTSNGRREHSEHA